MVTLLDKFTLKILLWLHCGVYLYWKYRCGYIDSFNLSRKKLCCFIELPPGHVVNDWGAGDEPAKERFDDRGKLDFLTTGS